MSLKYKIVVKLATRWLRGKVSSFEKGSGSMRWDKLLQGAAFSGLLTAALSAAPFFTDGKITGAEAMMLAGAFFGGVALYIKQHPPVESPPSIIEPPK